MTVDTLPTPQRRQHARVLFHAPGDLAFGDGTVGCEVLDLSLKGALLLTPSAAVLAGAAQLTVALGADARIVMDGEVAGQIGRQLHFRCTAIDLDSMTHLRNLVALNAGDAALLERELTALVAAND
jgi:hypothetical protein